MTVDEFVQARVLPEFRDIVEMLRHLVREMSPDAEEVMYRGVPAFKRKHVFAVISPTKKDITLAFARGSEFEDKYGLLKGAGNVSLHIKLKSLDTVNMEALGYYMGQAVEREGSSLNR